MAIDVADVPAGALARLRLIADLDPATFPDDLVLDTIAARAWEADGSIFLDLHSSAADLLEDSLPGLAAQYNFNADGGNFTRSQAYQQRMGLIRWHRSRRASRTIEVANG